MKQRQSNNMIQVDQEVSHMGAQLLSKATISKGLATDETESTFGVSFSSYADEEDCTHEVNSRMRVAETAVQVAPISPHVKFGTIEIREYAVTLGDHPHADAYPLSLDWNFSSPKQISLQKYEAFKDSPLSPGSLKMTRTERRRRIAAVMGIPALEVTMQEEQRRLREFENEQDESASFAEQEDLDEDSDIDSDDDIVLLADSRVRARTCLDQTDHRQLGCWDNDTSSSWGNDSFTEDLQDDSDFFGIE
jgi:hypothetical protein